MAGLHEIIERQKQMEAEQAAKPPRPKWKTILLWILRIAIAVALLKIALNVIEYQVIYFS